MNVGVRKKESQVTPEVPGWVMVDTGAISHDLKYWEGSKFGHLPLSFCGACR